MTPFLPVQETLLPIVVSAVEKKYNAVYVGDFCLKNKNGGWANEPAAVFWQPTPPVEGYSHYFGLLMHGSTLLITSGQSAFDDPIVGLVADNGEVVYSRYRHDFRTSSDGSVSIDGGRDYVKTTGNTTHIVHLTPNEHTLHISEISRDDQH